MKKSIFSEGGPLVALPRDCLHLWGGVNRTSFAGCPPNDYEAAGYEVDGSVGKPRAAAILRGAKVDGLVLAMPVETYVFQANDGDVCIVQVNFSDKQWCSERVSMEWFDHLSGAEALAFRSKIGAYVLFDSVCESDLVGDDFLGFTLNSDSCTMTSGLMRPDEHTLLTLVRIAQSRWTT